MYQWKNVCTTTGNSNLNLNLTNRLINRLTNRLTSSQNLIRVGVDVYINHVLCVYHHSRSKSTAQFRFPFVEWCLFRIAPFFQIKNKNVKTLNYWKIFVDSSLSMSKWYVKIIQGIWWWKKVREKPKFFALVTFTRRNLAILICCCSCSCSSSTTIMQQW